jgi:hypothetical protein
MKTISTLRKVLFAFIVLISLKCKKENASAVVADQSSNSQNASLNDQNTRLVLQPGPEDGSDAVINKLLHYADSRDGNLGQVPELYIEAWTINRKAVFTRCYIKFNDLSSIPSKAKITSSHLYLYGVPNSTSNPNGNSIYPGSPYNQWPDNRCLVSRVRKDWNEDSITWNNAPQWYETLQDTIPVSTSRWNYNVVLNVEDMVTRMVRDSSNYGFPITLLNETKYRSMIFASSENPDATKRPKLIVNYRIP